MKKGDQLTLHAPIISQPELRNKSLVAGRFICGDILVRTRRSCIYQGWDIKKDQSVVLKKPTGKVDSFRVRELQREGLLLRLNQHPGLLRGEGYVFCHNQHWLIMAPAPGILLLDFMKSGGAFQWNKSVRHCFVKSLADSLRQLNERGWYHGDIKPDNIYVNSLSGEAFLIDFSASDRLENSKSLCAFSSDWLHPSLLKKSNGRQVDIYSFALLIWCLWTGRHPFEKKGVISFTQSPARWPLRSNWKVWIDGRWLRKRLLKADALELSELVQRFGV